MSADPQRQQRLLELIHDLLPKEEAEEMRRKIEADPELAREYKEARAMAELFADAAKMRSPEVSPMAPKTPATITEQDMNPNSGPSPSHTTVSADAKASNTAGVSKPLPRPSWGRTANVVVGISTVLLLLVSVGGYLYHREELADIAAEHLRLTVSGPARLQVGTESRYTIMASAITGTPMPAQVQFALLTPDGGKLLARNEKCDDEGRLSVTIPADLKLPRRAKMVVTAIEGENREEVETTLAVEPPRFLTHLTTDKPLYRPGETVYYRSLTLSRSGLAVEGDLPIMFEIRGPGGALVVNSQLRGVTQEGVGNGAFPIPGGLPGGEYTLSAKGPGDAFPEAKRTFHIRAYRLPRLKKELEFVQDSYGPDDMVVADFSVNRAEDGVAAGAKLQITASVDGETIYEKTAEADTAGAMRIEFRLPKEIERGNGQLAIVVDDGGNRETIAKSIPINLGKVEVVFYPEGGDLVAGLENRVYFVARDPLGEPVHIKGVVVGLSGSLAADVETTHEGMGAFSFRPREEETYRLRIANPLDTTEQPELPKVLVRPKLVMHTGTGVFAADEPLEFNIRAGVADMPLVVTAFCRGVQVGQSQLVTQLVTKGTGAGRKVVSRDNPVVIPVGEEVHGVVRLTVYDFSTTPPTPVAERLVYRRPKQQLAVAISDDRKAQPYSPGENVDLSLTVKDEMGEPVAAVLGVAVVDDALLNLADDKTTTMSTHFLLANEIEKPEDLEDVNFYLGDDSEAPVALDLLLGTQGWRRFAMKTLDQFEKEATDSDVDAEDDRQIHLAAIAQGNTPPAMFDNLSDIREGYETSLAAYRANRTKLLNTLTTVSFFAGLGLVLLVAMLGLLKVVSGMHLWASAIGVTTCSLALGVVVMDPARLMTGGDVSVAFAPFHVELPSLDVSADALDASGQLAEGNAGAWYYFDGDEDGRLAFWSRGKANGQWDADLWAEGNGMGLMGGMQAGGMGGMGGMPMLGLGNLQNAIEGGHFFAYDGSVANLELAGGGLILNGRGDAFGDVALDANAMQREAAGFVIKDIPAFGRYRRLENVQMGQAMGWIIPPEAQNIESYRFPVREYAHVRLENGESEDTVRSDFAETLCWRPLVLADAQGKATVSFQLSDSVTTFKVCADAHGGGRIGSGTGRIVSRIPFNLEPKLPLEVNAGDRIELPLAVVNDTQAELPVALRVEHGELLSLDGEAGRAMKLAAGKRAREYFTLGVTGQSGGCELLFRGTAEGASGKLSDQIRRTLKVVPPGFPREQSYGGRIEGEEQTIAFDLPEDWVPGSLEVTVSAFPSTLADLQQGMESMLREPSGCFEQASTSNYPNVLSLQYMEWHDVADPAITRRAKDLLGKGYGKLTSYECKTKGYEWFGGDPGHEALTAYGLMEFRDMADVHDVDPAMLKRTAQWLLDRRDGKGGFKRNAKALDSFGGAPEDITNAYITWALAESGQNGIAPEIEHVAKQAEASDDPYLVALAAAAVTAKNEYDKKAGAIETEAEARAKRLLDKLTTLGNEDGHLEGTRGSITRSGGLSLKMETTALAALAWLRSAAHAEMANRAIAWIVDNRQGCGGFGSTQGTILALKALVAHSQANAKTVSAGKLVVKRGDRLIGEQDFAAGERETIVVEGLEAELVPGENRLTIGLSSENRMPYALDVRYRTLKPASDEACPLRLATKLAKETVKAGETVALEAELANITGEGQPMSMAILGLPAGLEARTEQLDELKKTGQFDYYETNAREVVLYWRALAPEQKAVVKLDLIATVPGEYTSPASRAYLYYTPEQKQWADPLVIQIGRE